VVITVDFSPKRKVIRMKKLRKSGWMRQVAHRTAMKNIRKMSARKPKLKVHVADLADDGQTTLKLT